MRKEGFDGAKSKLRNLSARARENLVRANRENGEEVIALAKVLVPSKSGTTRRLITGTQFPDGSYLMDFAPLGRILEGGTEQRVTKEGESRGRGPKRPFVNPAMRATARKRRARYRKALKDAIRDA